MNTPQQSQETPNENFQPVQPDSFQAVDFQSVSLELEKDLEYLQETRVDYEHGGPPQPWITAVASALQTAIDVLRDLQITYAEEIVEEKNALGIVSELLLREQAPKDFAAFAEKYSVAINSFEEYFEKHRAMKLGVQDPTV